MRQQPTFWLEVRKEYVIENFAALLPYLRGYQYDSRMEADDSDFNKTFRCLREVVDDICQSMSGDNVPGERSMREMSSERRSSLMCIALLASAIYAKTFIG